MYNAIPGTSQAYTYAGDSVLSNGEVFSIGVDRRTDDEQNEQRDYDDFRAIFIRLRVHILSLL